MKSMTGFGYSEFQNEHLHVNIDLKSYNNRFLDIQVNLPFNLVRLEPRIRDFLGPLVKRGRLEVYVRFSEQGGNLKVTVDKVAAREYLVALKELAETAELADSIHLGHLLRLEGVLNIEKQRDLEFYWTALLPQLQKAYGDFEDSRLREGLSIQDDLHNQLKTIGENLALIEARKDELENHLKTEIKARFIEMLGDGVDENRVYAETAMLLIKFDINEEVVRINAHLGRFGELLDSGESVGKNLDFIAQELNREINTISAKSMNLEISRSVISIKNSIEKIREQLRNVE